MVETGEKGIERGLQRDDEHARRRKGEVEDRHGRQQEEQEREEDGAEQQLVEVVVARVDPVAQHVPLLAPEQVEQRDDGRQLPVVDARRGDVEAVDVDGQDRQQVRAEADRHRGPGEARHADERDDVWQ